MLGFRRKAVTTVLAVSLLFTSAFSGLMPQALDTAPSSKSPVGMAAYVDELFGGKVHGWTDGGTNDPTQDTLLQDLPGALSIMTRPRIAAGFTPSSI